MPNRDHVRGTDAAEPFRPAGDPPAEADGSLIGNWYPLPAEAPRRWFCLRVRANREFQVRAALQPEFATFLPSWSERVEWSDRTKTITRPLFPGYIFARLAGYRDFHVALQTRGVVQILPDSFSPLAVRDDEIDAVRRVADSKLLSRPCDYVAGENVVIDSGPLAGVAGVVIRTRGTFHVVVSIEMLQRSVRVELDAATLTRPKEN